MAKKRRNDQLDGFEQTYVILMWGLSSLTLGGQELMYFTLTVIMLQILCFELFYLFDIGKCRSRFSWSSLIFMSSVIPIALSVMIFILNPFAL